MTEDAQVVVWLRSAGLSRLAPRFTAALVTPPLFLQLSASDLDALGVDGPADRKRLSDLIAELRRAASLPPLLTPLPRAPTSHPVRQRRVSLAASAAAAKEALRPAAPHVSPSVLTPASTSPPPSLNARVSVCVRKRPLSRKEIHSSNRDVLTVNLADSSLFVHELREKVDLTKHVVTHPFTFDCVFGENESNAHVYQNTAKPLVDNLFAGGRGTCFAYGQTGAGKTFTMAGDGKRNPGLYTLAVRDIFDRIRTIEAEEWRVASEQSIDDFEPSDPPQVWISFYEIYASKLQDLLNSSSKLHCREDGNNEVQIVGLAHRLCEVEEDVLACIDEGSAARSTGVTGANDDSSRSHAVFQIEMRHPPSADPPQDANNAVRELLLRSSCSHSQTVAKGHEIGRLCFIDLAGSERGSDTACYNRQTRMEGAEINKSLLALKECIRAMGKRKDHTPFRGSKLTQVLKASFVGKNCKTVMIANISPASCNVEHTLNTLRYSDRVKEIKRDKNASNSAAEASKIGMRRATFTHSIPNRQTINSASAMPIKLSEIDGSDPEFKHAMREKFLNDRKSLPPQGRYIDSDAIAIQTRGTKRAPPRRNLSKLRNRASDGAFLRTMNMGLDDDTEPGGQRQSYFGKRRTPRASTMLPSRPSMAGTMLPRPPLRRKGTEPALLRANSMHSRSPVKRNVACEIDSDAAYSTSDEMPKTENRKHLRRLAGKSLQATTTMLTRRRARELKVEEPVSKFDESLAESSPDESGPEVLNTHLSRRSKNQNAAQSALRYYKKQNENDFSDEDLLFVSSDNLADETTAIVQERIGAFSSDNGEKEGNVSQARPRLKPNICETQASKTAALQRVSSPTISSETASTSTSPSLDGPGPKMKTENVNLTSVIRMHHVQIEELMRLTEADVALVNSAEKGEIDSQEYGMKLALNLSQKIDLVQRLQDKLVLLE